MFNKVYKHDLDEILEKVFNVNRKEYGKLNFWGAPINKLKKSRKKIVKSHYIRIKNADLNFPIIIYKLKNKWYILDGFHRTAKAYLIKLIK